MNKQWQFVLEYPLVGYATHQHPNTDRAKRYVSWKRRVRLQANCAGVPSEVDAGLAYEVRVEVRWRKRARVDTDKMLCGVLDGMWQWDRNALSVHAEAAEWTCEETATVTVIERWARKSTTGSGAERRANKERRSPRPASDPYSKAFRSRS